MLLLLLGIPHIAMEVGSGNPRLKEPSVTFTSYWMLNGGTQSRNFYFFQ